MYKEVFIIAPGEVMSSTPLVMIEGAKGQQVEDTGEVKIHRIWRVNVKYKGEEGVRTLG